MKIFLRIILLFLVVFSSFVINSIVQAETIVIQGPNDRHFQFSVEIAQTAYQRQKGLMNRISLSDESGMLFIFDHDQYVSMWMKDTLIPLDMIFIDREGTIVSIAKKTIPLSLTHINSNAEVRAVLEIKAGLCETYGIVLGQKISPLLWSH
jgi:uncharacterized membrane protein (UPF0127 family)